MAAKRDLSREEVDAYLDWLFSPVNLGAVPPSDTVARKKEMERTKRNQPTRIEPLITWGRTTVITDYRPR